MEWPNEMSVHLLFWEITVFGFVCLLLFYVLATSKIISGCVPICNSVHGDFILLPQATGTVNCYLTQLHYPDTEPTSPCPILIMPSARLGSDKYQF